MRKYLNIFTTKISSIWNYFTGESSDGNDSSSVENYLLGRLSDYLKENFLNTGTPTVIDPKTVPPVFQPYLKNGFVYQPKTGYVLRIMENKKFKGFFMDTPGYAFLCEFFPKKDDLEEREKWQIIENPETVENALSIWAQLKRRYPLINLSMPEARGMANRQPTKQFAGRFLTEKDDSITYQLWNHAGILLFQGINGQAEIGYRDINFEVLEDGVIKPKKEKSPNYKLSREVYVERLTNILDANNVPTAFEFSWEAGIDNAFVAEVDVNNPNSSISNLIRNTAVKVVSSMDCHRVGLMVTDQAHKLTTFNPSKINEDIRRAIEYELALNQNYVGYKIYKTGIIGDIRIEGDGTNDVEIKKLQGAELMLQIQMRENEAELLANQQQNAIKENNALTDYNVTVKNAQAEKEKVKLAAEAEAYKIEKIYKAIDDNGGKVWIQQMGEAISKFKPSVAA
jgi:regulator of protease activity HflC (stomatin/prohibitin superfamily)